MIDSNKHLDLNFDVKKEQLLFIDEKDKGPNKIIDEEEESDGIEN